MRITGVCTNVLCERAARGESTECYPGPGEYCPDCGEHLRIATESDPVPPPAPGPPLRRARSNRRYAAYAAIGIAIFTGGLFGGMQFVPALGIRVCTTTMTDRVAGEIVRTYSAHHSVWPFHYTVTRPGDSACDVRFYTAQNGSKESAIARDGVVVIVNPQNRITRLDDARMRDVFTGRTTDWSQLGGSRGAITAAISSEDSDEVHAVSTAFMSGQRFGAHVVSAGTAADVVRLVSGPRGIGAIGIVPFSIAQPAKVVALGRAPAPSTTSISDGRYPLSVRIMANSDFRFPAALAAKLLAYARSGDAAGALLRTALITKNGM